MKSRARLSDRRGTRTEYPRRQSSRPVLPPDATAAGDSDAFPYAYRIFGIALRSEIRLPRLDAQPIVLADGARPVDVRFRDNARFDGIVPPTDDAAWTLLAPRVASPESPMHLWRLGADGPYRYHYRDGAAFVIDADGTAVWAHQPEAMSIEDLSCYLLGPVLALVLRLRGYVCLHASGSHFGAGAIAFAGNAHAGKSTLAAAFALAGYEAMTDDTVTLIPTPRGFQVGADAPFLNLWPRSAELLLGDAEALPRWSETWDKRFLHRPDRVHLEDRPLHAIFELALASDGDGTTTRIVPLEGHEALVTLLRYARATKLLSERRRPDELAILADVVRGVPVFRIERAREATPQSVRAHIIEALVARGIE